MNDLIAVVYDFVKLGIFSTSLTQACAVAMSEILLSLVENIIDRKLRNHFLKNTRYCDTKCIVKIVNDTFCPLGP